MENCHFEIKRQVIKLKLITRSLKVRVLRLYIVITSQIMKENVKIIR